MIGLNLKYSAKTWKMQIDLKGPCNKKGKVVWLQRLLALLKCEVK